MLVRQGRQSRKFNQCKNILNKEVSGTLEVGMGHTIVDKGASDDRLSSLVFVEKPL